MNICKSREEKIYFEYFFFSCDYRRWLEGIGNDLVYFRRKGKVSLQKVNKFFLRKNAKMKRTEKNLLDVIWNNKIKMLNKNHHMMSTNPRCLMHVHILEFAFTNISLNNDWVIRTDRKIDIKINIERWIELLKVLRTKCKDTYKQRVIGR